LDDDTEVDAVEEKGKKLSKTTLKSPPSRSSGTKAGGKKALAAAAAAAAAAELEGDDSVPFKRPRGRPPSAAKQTSAAAGATSGSASAVLGSSAKKPRLSLSPPGIYLPMTIVYMHKQTTDGSTWVCDIYEKPKQHKLMFMMMLYC